MIIRRVTRVCTGVIKPTKLERRKDLVASRGRHSHAPELAGRVDLAFHLLFVRIYRLCELVQDSLIQILLLEQLAEGIQRILAIRVSAVSVGHVEYWCWWRRLGRLFPGRKTGHVLVGVKVHKGLELRG